MTEKKWHIDVDKGAPKLCAICQHAFDPHIIIGLVFKDTDKLREVPLAGYIICQVKGCMCRNTWGLQGLVNPDEIPVLTEEELDEYRKEFQTVTVDPHVN